LEIETDGVITPEEAFYRASEILVNHFSMFKDTFKISPPRIITEEKVVLTKRKKKVLKQKKAASKKAKVKQSKRTSSSSSSSLSQAKTRYEKAKKGKKTK